MKLTTWTHSLQVICQIGNFAFAHSPRYFHDPRSYRPQRWLRKDHPSYDPVFENDHVKNFFPFNQGPRMCSGSTVAWNQTRLFIAKVIWTFDIEMVPGQNVQWERDFKLWSMWQKPEFWIRLLPVLRDAEKAV